MYAINVGGVCPSGTFKYGFTCCCDHGEVLPVGHGCCWTGCSETPKNKKAAQSCMKNIPFPTKWVWDAADKKYRLYRNGKIYGKSIVQGIHRSA